MGQKYRIHAGRKREGSNAVAGFLEKGRNDIIKGNTSPVSIQVGVLGIPNGTQAWGVRLNKKGAIPDRILRVDDDEYQGEIKWLKWGDKKGTMIRARYIPGYQTIDKDYQDTKLGVKVIDGFLEGGDPISLITFSHGYNTYDEDEHKGLVEMLKIHHHNDKSISCNPEADGWMFTEVTEDDNTDQDSKLIDTKSDCLLIVKASANKPESVRNLFEIVKDINKSDNLNKDDASELYKWLQNQADQAPQDFSNKINKYKTNVSSVIEKALSYKLFDLTKDGHIAAGTNKKELLLSDVPEKGEKMLDWIFENCLEPEVYEAVNSLQKITDTLK